MAGTESESRPRMQLEQGTRFGPYEIVRKIGEGGMGEVYEALRPDLGRRVALKVLHNADSQGALLRFTREARIAATLDHPHVATCIDFGTAEGVMFLALEFLEGETLAARMARGPMPVAEVIDTLLPIASAIIAAHELKEPIVHRDLKPDNIMLARKFGVLVPKLLDFGIAKHLSHGLPKGPTASAAILGTPRYMAPEQVRDASRTGPSADQFSLGVILWEALAGQALFSGADIIDVLYRVATVPAPSVRTVAPEVPEALAQVIARMLAKPPSARFPSVRAAANALLPFASSVNADHWRPMIAAPDAAGLDAIERIATVATLPADQVVNALVPADPKAPEVSENSPSAFSPHVLGVTAIALLIGVGWALSPPRAVATQSAAAPSDAGVVSPAPPSVAPEAPSHPTNMAGVSVFTADAAPTRSPDAPALPNRATSSRTKTSPRCGPGRHCHRDGGAAHSVTTAPAVAPSPPTAPGVDELPPIR